MISEVNGSRSQQQIEEQGKQGEISEDVLRRAREQAAKFFDEQLPEISNETQMWVIEAIAPGMVPMEMQPNAVSKQKVNAFLTQVAQDVLVNIELLKEINFSRGHELEERTYPSVQDIAPLAAWIKSLAEHFQLYKKANGFKSEFLKLFSPFLSALMGRVKNQALISRNTQLQNLLEKQNEMDEDEFVYQNAVIPAHIEAFTSDPIKPLLELRDLLNLSNIPRLKREPSMDEKRAVEFLIMIFE